MRAPFFSRVLKILILVVLVLSAHVLVCRVTFRGPLPKPTPVPEEHHRPLNPATYTYIHNQPAVCRDKSPFLVFLVPIGPGQVAERGAIRATWGAPGPDTLTLFFVGLPQVDRASETQNLLDQESRKHADIIQMNFLDIYHNLVIKTMMMMNWLAIYCPNSSFGMKVDADIFVNVFYLLRQLRSSPWHSFITGSVIRDGKPRRGRTSKWYLPKLSYAKDSFPVYVSGAGYVFSTDLASRITWASRFVRMIPLEDVYVGLCLQVLGVQPVYSRSFLPIRDLFAIQRVAYDRCTFAKLVIVNGFKPSELLTIWQDFSQGHLSC
ncbi:beta-1,3-galactosyltransferase 2 [Genypterus blacodes]|uniref:beta-1,3-galactosyltransferase 2 n=1 Tax=Genypterus blacodes TaxID=154954 RepID=UPI003F75EA7F